MNVKDVVKGKRVKFVGESNTIPFGSTGILIEEGTEYPLVNWDERYDCTYGYEEYRNVYRVYCEGLEIVDESITSKEIKIGSKVKVISLEKTEEYLGYSSNEMLRVGNTSNIVSYGEDFDACENVKLSDGFWYAVEDLEVIEELNVDSDKTLGNLKISLSVEDKNEITKDILQTVLQGLNGVITKAIKDLDTNNNEEESNFFDNYDMSQEKMYKLVDEVLKDVVKEQIVGIFKEK